MKGEEEQEREEERQIQPQSHGAAEKEARQNHAWAESAASEGRQLQTFTAEYPEYAEYGMRRMERGQDEGKPQMDTNGHK